MADLHTRKAQASPRLAQGAPSQGSFPMEVFESVDGQMMVRSIDVGIKRMSVDVYCGGNKRERIDLIRSRNGFFVGGPFARCPKGQTMRLEGDGSLLPGARPPAAATAQPPAVNPREGMRELPADRPLEVGPDSGRYFSRRSRAQIEADLRKHCTSGAPEDVFIVVEGTDAKGKKLSFTYKVGVLQQSTRVFGEYSSDFIRGIQSDFAKLASMSHYHFHPNGGKNEVGSEYPSWEDVKAAIEFALDGNRERIGYPAGLMDARIVTKTGVFIMKPNFAAIEADPENAKKEHEKFDEFFNKFTQIAHTAFADIPQADKCKRFAKAASSGFLQFSYHPFAK